MAFYAGKGGSISIRTSVGPDVYTSKPLSDWSIDIKTDALDVTNFTSGGWQEILAGIFSADISASGPYDGSSLITQGTAARMKLTVATGMDLVVDVRVNSVKIDHSVKDVAKISYSATSTGVHTFSV
jgi:predicted secreted protein